LAQRRDAVTGGQATRLNNDLSGLLARFAEEIASVRVLDPACGSGNFLSVSMQRLPNSEREVITFAAQVGLLNVFPKVGPEQTHGMETNEYAHGLATATGWIGYIQWLRDKGFFEGVCRRENWLLTFHDPPPSHNTKEPEPWQ
jgi:hypothetical protein